MKVNDLLLKRLMGVGVQYEWKNENEIEIWHPVNNFIVNVEFDGGCLNRIIVENSDGVFVLRDSRLVTDTSDVEKIKTELRSIRKMFSCKHILMPWNIESCFE